jgi:hypothetical protein
MIVAARRLLIAALLLHGPSIRAQSPQAQPVGLARRFTLLSTESSDGATATVGAIPATRVPVARNASAPWWAPAASLLVPGAGQFALGQQRSVAYLVAEAYFVVQALSAQRDGDRARDEYRAIASDVARRPFSAVRPIGNWAYYEEMLEHFESGQFDRIPGGAVDPETDETTYNGASWRLARENHWTNPDSAPAVTSEQYRRALAFYEARAVRDEFRWSWRDARLERGVYSETITSANRSYQRSVNLFGLVGANHLTSMIDAYITVRVRRYGGVRVAGLAWDGMASSVRPVGDPAEGRVRWSTAFRFVPAVR